MALSLKQKAMLVALRENFWNVSKACEVIGINRKTHYEWLAKNPQYVTLFEDRKEAELDDYEQALYEKGMAGDTQAIIFYLKTKGRKRGYSEKMEVEHSGSISGINLTVVDPDET